MRITRTPDDIKKALAARKRANKGCYVCPYCGNNKVVDAFDVEHREDAIIRMTFHTVKESLFHYKSGSIDTYKCMKCGSTWESEIY